MKNFLILFFLFIVACSNDNNVVQRLAQEPAIVREVKGANNLFVLDLQNANSGLYSSYIVPSATLPTDYKKNGLPVFISGDVTNNSVAIDGYISESEGNTIPINGKYNMVELNTVSEVISSVLADESINAFFEKYLPSLSGAEPECFFAGINEKENKCVIINSMDELKKHFLCSSNLLPAIDFNSYTLIIGQYYHMPSFGYHVVEQYLMRGVTNLELNINVEGPEYGLGVLTTLYYWGIYPKVQNKTINVNINYK